MIAANRATTDQTTFIYLHGFASSPSSAKAAFFRERFREWGLRLIVPDLNAPTFEHLTLTAMIRRLEDEIRACPPGPVCLIASSLGALVALHVVEHHEDAAGRRIARMILLAPSLKFLDHRQRDLGPAGMESWRARGKWPFFHYGLRSERDLGYQFVEDLGRYSVSLRVRIPTLVYHGTLDERVPIAEAASLSAANPTVRLCELRSDHRLTGSLDEIWAGAVKFFNLCNTYCAPTPVRIERHDISASGSGTLARSPLGPLLQILANAYGPDSLSADEHLARLHSTDHTLLLAFTTAGDGVAVGVSYIRHDGKRGATGVLPALQRHGIGRQLVCASLPLFSRQYTEISVAHDRMKRLLLSCGFVPVMDKGTLLIRLGSNARRVASFGRPDGGLRYTRDSARRPGVLREYGMLEYEPKALERGAP